MGETIGWVLAIVLFLAGLAGTVLPLLPGAPLIWLGMLAYGLLAGFEGLGRDFYIWQGIFVALVLVLDYLAGVWGTKRFGGSRAGAWGSFAGTFLGLIIAGPIGVILGPFLGALAGELLAGMPPDRAMRSAWGTIVGFVGGTFAKLIIEIGMIAWFLARVL